MHVTAPEGVSTCRSRGAKEWVEKVFDYVIACSSLTGIISDMQVIEDFESRPHKAIFVVERGKGRQESGTSKNCRRRFQDTVEEGYQGDARKREAERKKKNA